MGQPSIGSTFFIIIIPCNKDFELMALTINPMFSKEFDTKRIGAFMAELEIPFTSFEVDIAGTIEAQV